MKQIMVDETISENVKTSVQKLIVDDDLLQSVKEEIALLDSCNL